VSYSEFSARISTDWFRILTISADRKIYKTNRLILDMKRGAIIGLLFISVLLISIIAGCGSTDSSGSAGISNDDSSSDLNDDSQRFYSRNGVYSGTLTFTADLVFSRHNIDYNRATGATEHVSTTINFSGYKLGADVITRPWEVPVSGTYEYSCATTGNYVQGTSSFPASASYGGYAAAEPNMDARNGLKNGVTLMFDSSPHGTIVEPIFGCADADRGAGGLITLVIHDIFSTYHGNTDKLASDSYPTYFFNKEGGTVSFGRTFREDISEATGSGSIDPVTVTYSGSVTVVRDE
jgi:hypothetical protein